MKTIKGLAVVVCLFGWLASSRGAPPQVTVSEAMKQELAQQLSRKMLSPEGSVLKELYQVLEDSAVRQGFKKNPASPSIWMEAFNVESHRVDFTFRSAVKFERACPQIPRCAHEEISVTIEGVTMFVPATERVGYVIPSRVYADFYRSFYKGGGASVGGRK